MTVHTPPQPHVVRQMLLEFVAKEKLLQVSNCVQLYFISFIIVYSFKWKQRATVSHAREQGKGKEMDRVRKGVIHTGRV